MDQKLNGTAGDWYKLERQWKKTLKAGGRVQVNIKLIYKGDSKRPDSFVISFTENNGREINRILKNTPTGK